MLFAQTSFNSVTTITPTSSGTLKVNVENIDGCTPNNISSYSILLWDLDNFNTIIQHLKRYMYK